MGDTNNRPAWNDDDFYPDTIQDELNDILEAFFEVLSDDDVRLYQKYVEDITDKKIAETAIQTGEVAPDFSLEDQDGETVQLGTLCAQGPVVLMFYRGKWCPHCNAALMRMQRVMSKIEAKGAKVVAISPMLPDGTQYLASKRNLPFHVCSDLGCHVAKRYKLTFAVLPEIRDKMATEWGEDLPAHNGDDSWEIPLPATYVIGQDGRIVWSFIDNDPGVRAEPEDILDAIPSAESSLCDTTDTTSDEDDVPVEEQANKNRPRNQHNRRTGLVFAFKKSAKNLFGKRKQPPQEYLTQYLISS